MKRRLIIWAVLSFLMLYGVPVLNHLHQITKLNLYNDIGTILITVQISYCALSLVKIKFPRWLTVNAICFYGIIILIVFKVDLLAAIPTYPTIGPLLGTVAFALFFISLLRMWELKQSPFSH